ncbi:ABC transporter ATP-binding protein [Actinoplanes teichomyceticus]|uniref:ABC-2 type transport system ATP-binding protein n=1 Tax=Actinoplanes teichomyceticus TaxID=1867 RepID=A0A561VKS3_ACTTI|nr:ATP-binding cassette domain-containing protein [Actinoplanes teichomyceticus]TWG12216.1 ABC-2 type transport system ATP-binding protein [Actinoplanes teichomyceticus]GIF14150.1 ABC transporter ATP-binding protein [Actinoplanes teichomyceticus]
MALITVRQLTKEYVRTRPVRGRFGTLRTLFTREKERTLAVDHIDFTVDEGEVVGCLGPNGAGKSTTIKLLTGVLWPTGGTVEVAGPDGPAVPWRDRKRIARRIGVVFGQRSQLWWDLPLIESFKLVAALYDVPGPRYAGNLARLRRLLELDPFLHTPVRQLSLGQRMRGDLAAALLHDPPVLYLDEPTVGLDVLAKETVRGFVDEANRSGRTTVLLTTHDLADVERLCRRILLIDHGRVLYDGPVDGLVRRYAPHRDVLVRLDGAEPAGDRLTLDGFVGEREHDGRWRFRVGRDEPVHRLLAAAGDGRRIRDLSVVESNLESVVRELYRDRREG